MDPLESKVGAALARVGFDRAAGGLVVAVSGGADSLALLYCLVGVLDDAARRLHVAHLNHDFRGEEADEDARFVSEIAGRLGLTASVEKADPAALQKEQGISSFEEAARELRYGFLARTAAETSAWAIATGHTADDLAETVLMHLIRGSGVHGLRGMDELSPWKGRLEDGQALLFRPLLGVTKRETMAYCERRGIAFREDSGNQLMQFTRNRIRHELLPVLERYNPRVREALVRLAHSASLEVDYLEAEVQRAWASIATQEGSTIVLDRGALSALHPLMRRMVLRRAYQRLTGDTSRLGEVHLKAMESAAVAPAGKVLELPRGVRLHTGYGRLNLGRDPTTACPLPCLNGEHELRLPISVDEVITEIPGWRIAARLLPPSSAAVGDELTACLDIDVTDDVVTVRTRLPGDRFQPAGMRGEKKLQDFFVDEKVPRAWRDRVPLVVARGRIAWVVGHRVAQWARAREDSQGVCEIGFVPRLP